MSRTVDERVVEMRFDNKEFESNVQTSMSTLQKLKQCLNLDGAAKGLETVSTAAKSCNLSGLSGAVDTVKVKFSALEVMGITALANITNSAVNAGKRIVSALTIDPVKTGFQEYETQINAIQTILANTESKGSTLQDVNAALDELNHYADLTIYNFTEMTRNIGTFTAAGVDLDTSVSAIKGIANLAAVSGSTSQQASTAMYQLSQALAAGTVKVQDWNSVVNAGMGGQVFQDALKETARVHNIAIDDMITKEGSFRETLSNGWLTSEILTETLSKFTGDLSEAQLKQMGYADEQIASIIKMGQTANDAATKVKTLSQLWDTLQEAAQSGWTKTWQLMIGDFEEATELFTGISDTVSNFINASADRRNNLLEDAMLSNWGKLTKAINEAGLEASDFEEKIKEVLFSRGRNSNKIIEQYGSIEKACKSGAISADILKEALNKLNAQIVDLSGIDEKLEFGSTGDNVKKIQEALQGLDIDIGETGVDGIIGSRTQAAIEAFQKMQGLEVTGIIDETTLNALSEACNKTTELGDDVFALTDKITTLEGRENIIEGFKNIFAALGEAIAPVKEALQEVFPPITSEQIKDATEKFKTFAEKLKVSEERSTKLKSTFKGVFSVINLFKKGITALIAPIGKFIGSGGLNGIGNALLSITASIGDFFTSLDERTSIGSFFTSLLDGIFGVFRSIGGVIDPALEKVESFGDVFSAIKTVVCDSATSIFDAVKQALNSDTFSGLKEKISPAFDVLAKKLSIFAEQLKGITGSDILNKLKNIKDAVVDFFKNAASNSEEKLDFTSVLDEVSKKAKAFGEVISHLKNSIKDSALSVFDKAKEKIISFKDTLSNVKDTICNSINNIVEKIKELITSVSGKISNKKMLSGLALIGVLSIVKKIVSVFKTIRGFFKKDNSGGIVDGIQDVLEGTSKALSSFSRSIKIASLVSIAAAILLLSSAMKNISTLTTDQILTSLGTIGLLLAELTITLGILNKTGNGGFGNGVAILSTVLALNKLMKILEKTGKMEIDVIEQGLVVMGVALTELATALYVMRKLGNLSGSDAMKSGGAILLMAIALKKIGKVMNELGSMSWSEIAKGLVGMGVALAEVVAAITVLNHFSDAGGSLMASGAIFIVTSGLGDLASALKSIGDMEWDEIAKGLVGMGGALAEVGTVTGLLGNLTGGLAILGSASLWVGIQGLNDLATAFAKFGDMEWDEIGQGLAAMGGALGETALGGLLNSFSGLGALTIRTMAKPLGDLADSVKEWTGISVPDGLGTQLGNLATGIKKFNFGNSGAHAISTVASPLGDLADSVSKWVDITVPDGIDTGLDKLATGVKKFNFSGWGADAIAAMGSAFGDLGDSVSKWVDITVPDGIDTGLEKLATGAKAFNFSGWGADAIKKLAGPFGDLADSMAKWSDLSIDENLGTNLSSLATGLGAWEFVTMDTLEGKKSIIADFASAITPWNSVSVPDGIGDSLSGMATGLDAMADVAVDNLNNVSTGINTFKTAAESLLDIDFTTIASNLSTFAGSISNVNVSTDTFTNLGNNIVDKFTSAINSGSGNMSGVGSSLVDSITSGMSAGSSTISSAVSSLLSSASAAGEDNYSKYASLGKYLIAGLIAGIKERLSDVKAAGNSVALAGNAGARTDSNYNKFYSTGSYLVSGFVSGIRSKINSAAVAAADMASSALSAANNKLQVNSPSKVFYRTGAFAGMGFVNALMDYREASYNAGLGIASSAREGLNRTISKLSENIQNGIDATPTIRPVLDLSAVKAGAGQISGLIGMDQTIDVARNVGAISSMMSNRQNGTTNDDVVSAIGKLQKTLGNRTGDSYVINGVTYDDGSNVASAVQSLIQAARMERRG